MTSYRHGRPACGSTFEDMENIMDTFRMMAYAIRDQATAVNCLMERVDYELEKILAKILEEKEWIRNIKSLLNFAKQIHLIFERPSIWIKLKSGLKLWRNFSPCCHVLSSKRWPWLHMC